MATKIAAGITIAAKMDLKPPPELLDELMFVFNLSFKFDYLCLIICQNGGQV